MRSPVTGLVGNVLHTDSKDWVHKESSIGAGIDSYYEYLLKVSSSCSVSKHQAQFETHTLHGQLECSMHLQQ